ncbi:MAG: hypothetical protein PGN33_20700 [Methylobacterium radiotolerans]
MSTFDGPSVWIEPYFSWLRRMMVVRRGQETRSMPNFSPRIFEKASLSSSSISALNRPFRVTSSTVR